jgi:hypothetical protein
MLLLRTASDGALSKDSTSIYTGIHHTTFPKRENPVGIKRGVAGVDGAVQVQRRKSTFVSTVCSKTRSTSDEQGSRSTQKNGASLTPTSRVVEDQTGRQLHASMFVGIKGATSHSRRVALQQGSCEIQPGRLSQRHTATVLCVVACQVAANHVSWARQRRVCRSGSGGAGGGSK